MASIRKRGCRWEGRVRRGNNPTKCKSFTKQADAKIWAYQTELELERASTGISPAPIKLNLFEAKKRYISELSKDNVSQLFAETRNDLCEG